MKRKIRLITKILLLLSIFLISIFINQNCFAFDDTNALIMEWDIPANTEIKLPIYGTGNNYTVNWGDGSNELSSTAIYPSHTYVAAGTYTIKVAGTVNKFGNEDSIEVTTDNDKYTFTQYLKNVIQVGNLNYALIRFSNCTNVESINFTGGFNISPITTSLAYMFYNCSKIQSLNLSSFNTSNITSMLYMFYSCTSLTSLNISSFDTSKVTSFENMFYNCSSITSIDVSNFDTSLATTIAGMFGSCSSLINLDVSNFKTSNVQSMQRLFSGCTNLQNINVSNFDTLNVTMMDSMFSGCNSLTYLDLSHFNTSKVTKMNSMFSSCQNITSLDLSNFNTTLVDTFYNMFHGCTQLVNLDISSFNTSNVKDMSYMFRNCSNLTYIDVSNFNTSKVSTMAWMFNGCSSLTEINVTGFNTSNCTSLIYMFAGCTSLKELDVSGFSTSKCTSMNYMFYNCVLLKYLDLSNFDMSKCNELNYMVNKCSALEVLVLGENFSKISGTNMFNNCANLKSIITLKSISASSEAPTLTTNTGLNSTAVLYVPNATSKNYYVNANNYNTVFGSSRIKTILEPKNGNTAATYVGSVYGTAQDAGALVAGYSVKTEPASPVFSKFGFSVTKSGLPVDTSTTGNKTVTYTLKRNNANVMNTTRTVTVSYVDTTAPIGIVKIQNKIVANNNKEFVRHRSVTLRVSAQDDVAATQIAIANENARSTVTWNSFTYPSQDIGWTLSSGNGDKTVYVMLKDAAGNTSVSFQNS